MDSNFLKYYEGYLKNSKIANFKLLDGETEDIEYKTIADSSYNETFNRLFSRKLVIDNITGEERLKSLLNSLFYPNVDDNGYKIKEITEIENDQEYLCFENVGGYLSFDIACRCTCWEGKEKRKEDICDDDIFDVLMKSSFESDFIIQLLEYGFSSRYNEINIKEDKNNQDGEENKGKKQENMKKKGKKRKPIKILSFLNYDNYDVNKVNHKSYKTVIIFEDPNGNTIRTLKNPPIEIYSINLPFEIGKLSKNEPIQFNHKKLGKTGVEWIKLLGLKHWANTDKYPLYHKYIIPKNTENSDGVIQTAIKILEMVDISDLKEFVKNEKIFLGQLKGAEEIGGEIGRKKAREKRKREEEKNFSYKLCETMLNNNEDIERISLYSKLSIEEIIHFHESLKKNKNIKK